MDYNKLYNKIVTRAKDRVIEGYTEKHHIVPKCLGGSDDKSNIVSLTAKEHFMVHKLLVYIYPSSVPLWHAFRMMSVKGKGQKREKILTANDFKEMREALLPFWKKNALAMKNKPADWSERQRQQRLKDGITPPYKGIPVKQYTLEGGYIRTYKSAQDAINKTGITTIDACFRGRQKQAGGFRWKQIK